MSLSPPVGHGLAELGHGSDEEALRVGTESPYGECGGLTSTWQCVTVAGQTEIGIWFRASESSLWHASPLAAGHRLPRPHPHLENMPHERVKKRRTADVAHTLPSRAGSKRPTATEDHAPPIDGRLQQHHKNVAGAMRMGLGREGGIAVSMARRAGSSGK